MKNGLVILMILWCAVIASAQQGETLPKIQREFRGMWIATVANLDYPSSPNLTAEQQKAELVKLMDLAEELRINAVVFQVSSMRDAVYQSEIDPTSEFLTGKMGGKIEFDPLKFAVEEAHRRGILLHAWFNPYRASHASAKGEAAENHITKRRPDLVRTYNNAQILDPAEKDVQDYLVGVIADVVKRYDVDAVHFDDYFYPYPDAARTDFPDDKTWKAYKDGGGKLSRGDWRRKNVDDLIQRVAIEIKKIKPNVMFGVSPFGIWKPDETQGIKGLSSYDAIYSDSRKWLQEGWVDYLAPQLYWSTAQSGQQFATLMKWWNAANTKKRHLWAGIATYKVGAKADYSAKEILDEIAITRLLQGDGAGVIHFRALSIVENKDNIKDALRDKAYVRNAIIPASPWINHEKPVSPQIEAATDAATKNVRADWKNAAGQQAFRWILYFKIGGAWKATVLPGEQTSAEVPAQLGVEKFAVSSVDRLGNVSEPTFKTIN